MIISLCNLLSHKTDSKSPVRAECKQTDLRSSFNLKALTLPLLEGPYNITVRWKVRNHDCI